MGARRITGVALIVAAVLILAACAAGPNEVANSAGAQDAGFWLGLWHGLICPIAFIVSLFNDNVNVYEVHNNGDWYNFGFVLGIVLVAGSGGASRRRR
jgi:uncharacterized spore protein YtfJ